MHRDIDYTWLAVFPDERSVGESVDTIKKITRCNAAADRGLRMPKLLAFEVQARWQRVEDLCTQGRKLLQSLGIQLEISPWSYEMPYWTLVDATLPDVTTFDQGSYALRTGLFANEIQKGMGFREVSRSPAYGPLRITQPWRINLTLAQIRDRIASAGVLLIEPQQVADAATLLDAHGNRIKTLTPGENSAPDIPPLASRLAVHNPDPRPLVVIVRNGQTILLDRGNLLP